MPKLIPVADELSKPFWDAVNAKKLVLQHCGACNKLQYPPQKTCQVCGSDAKLTWKEVKGKGQKAMGDAKEATKEAIDKAAAAANKNL